CWSGDPGEHSGAHALGQLNCSKTDSPSAAENEHTLALLQSRALAQGEPGGVINQGHGGRVDEGHRGGQLIALPCIDADLLGITPMFRQSQHAVADLQTADARSDFAHYADRKLA